MVHTAYQPFLVNVGMVSYCFSQREILPLACCHMGNEHVRWQGTMGNHGEPVTLSFQASNSSCHAYLGIGHPSHLSAVSWEAEHGHKRSRIPHRSSASGRRKKWSSTIFHSCWKTRGHESIAASSWCPIGVNCNLPNFYWSREPSPPPPKASAKFCHTVVDTLAINQSILKNQSTNQ